MDAGFRQLLNFPRGVVVQLVRTLHCHVCPINLTLSLFVGDYGTGLSQETTNAKDFPRKAPQES